MGASSRRGPGVPIGKSDLLGSPPPAQPGRRSHPQLSRAGGGQVPSQLPRRVRRGRGLDSPGGGGHQGEDTVCPWAERGGDSSRRGGRRMRALRADNDLPVHLKGGATDNILYRLTMMLTLGGSVYSLYCLGWASFPHKK
uniref:Cytochrome c oxidase subunit 7A1, mitochondrial n=1 Tax=Urocitellus parryii TaxID=9999 RepID=A0A8D2HML8_UROPR